MYIMKMNNFFKVFKWICLVGYITLGATLIIEACINGENSTNQSNSVGGTLADVFNDLSGDQAELVDPESVQITNKIENANVGDEYRIITSLTPFNSSCSSFYYTSSDLNVAKISNDGNISFLTEGQVTITVTNQQFSNVYDSMVVNVNEVKATSIKASIASASYDKTSNTYYLYTNKIYTLSPTFVPSNTTNKDVIYTSSSNEYLTINEKGVIIPKVNSYNKITEITMQQGNLSVKTNVVVRQEKVNDALDFSIDNISLYVGETKKVEPTFNPINTTFKNIELVSPSASIKIEDDCITGLAEDTVTLLVKSTRYNISKEIKVNILPQRELQSFEMSLNNNVVVGSETKINLFNILPSFANTTSISYSSSNENVGIVENGYFIAKQIGSTTINATYGDCYQSLVINVKEKLDNISDFTFNQYDNNLETQKLYDLHTLFTVETFYPSIPNSKNLSYSLSDPTYGEIVNDVLYLTKAGKVDLIITHVTSGKSKSIPLYIKYPFKILDINNNELNELSPQFGEDITFTIDDNSNNTQKYEFNYPSSIVINEYTKNDIKYYTLSTLENSSSYLEITPVINNNKIDSSFINVDIEESTILSLGYKLSFVALDKKMSMANLTFFPISVRSEAYIRPMAERKLENGKVEKIELDHIYHKNITYQSEDESIVEIIPEQNGTLAKIKPVSPGATHVIVQDMITGEKIRVQVLILNQVIVQDAPYLLTGNTLKEDGTNYYQITNGNSASLVVNFNYEKTTYFNVQYHSSNPEVATINNDGVITTLKEGKTDISFICHDGISPERIDNIINYRGLVKATIHLTVNKLELITDLNSFFLLVRKGIGHFGAFLVLGIFSTFTYCLFFNKKKWKWTLPLNIIQGVTLAAITEIIQLLVPGRAGLLSDVLIDCLGFIISALIISIVMIIIGFHKKKQPKKEIIIEIKEMDD